MKGKVNYDNSRHEADLKIISLNDPRPSTKHKGVFEIL